MNFITKKRAFSMTRLLSALTVGLLLLLPVSAYAAAPGITGTSFDLTAKPSFITQPDGSMVYSWGYGCNTAPAGFNPPAAKMPGATCPSMQVPGPTLIVTEGQTVSVTLHNALPAAAGTLRFCFRDFK